MKLNKVLTAKILSVLLLTMYVVSTFFNSVYADETIVDWDTFGVDINQAGAYSYWFKNGLSNIVYQEQQTTGYVITTTYGQHNYNLSYQGILTGTYTDMYVYNYNGELLGKYHSAYHTTTNNGTNKDYITYINFSNQQAWCERCYVGFETDDDLITKITEAEYQSQNSGNNNYVNRFQQVIPSLKGTYSHPTTYNNRYKGIAYPNGTYTISFMSNLQLNYITPSITLISDRDISALSVKQVEQTNISNWDLRTFEVTNNGNVQLPFDFYISQFNNKSVEIIPIYQGEKNAMTPQLYALAYNKKYIYETHDNELINLTDTRTQSIIDIISSGNNASQQTVNNNQNVVEEADNTITDYNTINSSFENDFHNNMNNINTDLRLQNNEGFRLGINWVRVQFNELASYPHINLIITYSLLIGLAMLIMSRVL